MILALDFETGGLDPKRNFPVSLGIALMENDVVFDKLEIAIAPPLDKDGRVKREYNVVALEISGMSWAAIKKGLSAKEALLQVQTFVTMHDAKYLPVVAFNAPFDLSFWSELCFEGGGWDQRDRCYKAFSPPLIGPWQCSRLMAMDALPMPRYSLDTVCEALGLSRSSGLHGALEDAILAGTIYAQLSKQGVGV